MSFFGAIAFATLFTVLTLLNPFAQLANVAGETASEAVFDDEFNAGSLDSHWKWVDPRQDCSYNLTENPGYLRFHVPGNNHDLDISNGNQNAPRILQTMSSDFIIETKVVFRPTTNFQSAGILLWSSTFSFIRFERGYTDTYPNQIIQVREALTDTPYTTGGWVELGTTAYNDDIVYMKVERKGNLFTFAYASNVTAWSPIGSDTIPLGGSISVGLFALVQGNNDALYADFDYFQVLKRLPSPPRNLRAFSGTKLINLAWFSPEDNGGAPVTNYKIYRGNYPNTETYQTTLGNTTTYTDTNIISGQGYYYRVSALTSAGESDLSNEASVIPVSPPEETGLLNPIILAIAFIALASSTIPLFRHRKDISLKNMRRWLRENKREIVVVIGWASGVTLILIKIYALSYIYNPWLRYGSVPLDIYTGPVFESLDLALLFVVSLFAGWMLVDLDRIFYGYLISMISSFWIAVAYATLYIWNVLGWGTMLSNIAFAWEWAFYWAAINMFRAVFPFPIILAFLGGFFGSLLKSWLKP